MEIKNGKLRSCLRGRIRPLSRLPKPPPPALHTPGKALLSASAGPAACCYGTGYGKRAGDISFQTRPRPAKACPEPAGHWRGAEAGLQPAGSQEGRPPAAAQGGLSSAHASEGAGRGPVQLGLARAAALRDSEPEGPPKRSMNS